MKQIVNYSIANSQLAIFWVLDTNKNGQATINDSHTN